MPPYIDLLARRCPAWATIARSQDALDVDAAIESASGRPLPVVRLSVWVDYRLRVKQRAPALWPEGCPERHMESGGTFCLGKGAPLRPMTNGEADTWWEWLREFVKAQFFADRNAYWPTRYLHHGDAADAQIEMEKISAGTVFEEDVRQALDEHRGWLAGDLPRLVKNKSRLVNLRAPCPRGCCKRKAPLPKGASRTCYPKLRKACKQRELALSLIRLEYKRREKEDEFWKTHPRKVCCGTMQRCPLRQEKDNQ